MTELLCEEKTVKAPKKERMDAPLCVCFVCTGNTCRSPMAAAVANALAEEAVKGFPDSVRDCVTRRLESFSAGLYAEEGDPISAHAVEALEAAEVASVAGRDYHRHTAHTVTEEDVVRADVLVGMSGSHAMELMMRFPVAAKKIVCMPKPISDPFGGDSARYQACLAEITDGVKRLFFEGAGV